MSQNYKIGQFIIGKKIGQGSYSKVYIGFHETTGVRVAIKRIDKKTIEKERELKRQIEREIGIMKIVDHKNILPLFTVYETSKSVFIIMELCDGGSLFDYVSDNDHLPLDEVLLFFQQLIVAVEHLHQRKICHHDLKPENILLSKDHQQLKLCDFGMASYCGDQKLSDYCGSPHYAAPEICLNKPHDGCISDIWSCGVILFVMVFGELPFDDDDVDVVIEKITSGDFEFPSLDSEDSEDSDSDEELSSYESDDSSSKSSESNILGKFEKLIQHDLLNELEVCWKI